MTTCKVYDRQGCRVLTVQGGSHAVRDYCATALRDVRRSGCARVALRHRTGVIWDCDHPDVSGIAYEEE